MNLFRRRGPSKRQLTELKDILQATRKLTLTSQAGTWAHLEPDAIVRILDSVIETLDREETPDISETRILMAPTGDLQETAIENGWSDEYMYLSPQFDDLTKRLG